jgi:hypothetical protein
MWSPPILVRRRSPDRLIDDSPDHKPQIILMEHPETDFSWVSHHSGPTSSSRAVSVIGASAVLDSDQEDLGFSPR